MHFTQRSVKNFNFLYELRTQRRRRIESWGGGGTTYERQSYIAVFGGNFKNSTPEVPCPAISALNSKFIFINIKN